MIAPRTPPRLAVLDLDGTLVDSREDLCRAVNHALGTLGLPPRSLDEVSSFVGEGATVLVSRALGPGHLHLLEPALAAWWEHYREHLLDHTVLYPGLADVVAAARVPLAIHTNKPGALARAILAGLGVADRFVEVVGGDEAPRKPDPEGTRALLARQGVRPEDAILVGDSTVDLRLARAVPLRFVGVTWGLVPEARLAAEGAEVLVRRAADLAPWLGVPAPS
jgi:phosphoglycolate phosphatase